jgi:hypothetical protein
MVRLKQHLMDGDPLLPRSIAVRQRFRRRATTDRANEGRTERAISLEAARSNDENRV